MFAVPSGAFAYSKRVLDNPDEVPGLNTFCPLSLHGPLFHKRDNLRQADVTAPKLQRPMGLREA